MKPTSFAVPLGGFLFFTATAACSLVGFDGFVGPADGMRGDGGGEGLVVEASTPSTDDGGTNGLGGDGSTGDANTDAPDPNIPPVFVSGGSFCSQGGSSATFCEDFDTADLPAQWVREGVLGRLTSYLPKSIPNVFLVDAPATTAGGTFVAKISHDFDDPSTNLIVGFDFKPEQATENSAFLILGAVEWARGNDKYSLRLVYSNGSVRLEESNLVPPPNNKDSYHPFFIIPLNEWTRIGLDIVASGASPGVQLTLDGAAIGARYTITPTPGMDPRPTLILGAVFAGSPHTGWRLRYDDVTLTMR